MIRVRDPEKTVKMKERVQAFDHHRDEQGVLHFGLYDPATNQVLTEACSKEEEITPGAINFLERCWKTTGTTPDVLVMDASMVSKSLNEFLAAKEVSLCILRPGDMQRCGPLERAFKRPPCGIEVPH